MWRRLSGIALLLLNACVSLPSGPSVMVLPGTGKNFDQFRADDTECKSFAQVQIGGETPDQAAANSTAKSAVAGTAIGAIAGGAIDGRNGAAAGAGIGLLTGAAAGANAGAVSGYSLQRRYDIGYIQCMYAKGNSVPTASNSRTPYRPHTYPPPSAYPPPGYPPPPPPGYPPPPPGY